MRASTAYFVGAGTIIVAIAIGLGGGIVAGNIMNPIAPKQGADASKMAQRTDAASAPAPASSSSERVQYLTGSQAFGTIVAAPAQAEAKPEAAKPDTQAIQANAELSTPPPSQAAAVEPPKPPPASSAKPVEQQASTSQSSSSDNASARDAYAKARDSDVKRAASERRRAERRERWAERRHYESRDPRAMRDRTDWDDVARNIREDSDTRDYANRPRSGLPQIRLFGADDDD